MKVGRACQASRGHSTNFIESIREEGKRDYNTEVAEGRTQRAQRGRRRKEVEE
jgi:hypothetical protein